MSNFLKIALFVFLILFPLSTWAGQVYFDPITGAPASIPSNIKGETITAETITAETMLVGPSIAPYFSLEDADNPAEDKSIFKIMGNYNSETTLCPLEMRMRQCGVMQFLFRSADGVEGYDTGIVLGGYAGGSTFPFHFKSDLTIRPPSTFEYRNREGGGGVRRIYAAPVTFTPDFVDTQNLSYSLPLNSYTKVATTITRPYQAPTLATVGTNDIISFECDGIEVAAEDVYWSGTFRIYISGVLSGEGVKTFRWKYWGNTLIVKTTAGTGGFTIEGDMSCFHMGSNTAGGTLKTTKTGQSPHLLTFDLENLTFDPAGDLEFAFEVDLVTGDSAKIFSAIIERIDVLD